MERVALCVWDFFLHDEGLIALSSSNEKIQKTQKQCQPKKKKKKPKKTQKNGKEEEEEEMESKKISIKKQEELPRP